MSISSISSTQSPPVSGLVAPQFTHHKKAPNELKASALAAAPAASTTDAGPLASAIAGALAQLGLTPSTADADNTVAASGARLASLPQRPLGAQQVQQYKNIASTFSNLAQSLNASASSASSTASGNGSLTTVFQNLWTSLGSPPETSTDASNSTIPSLPLFLQTLARNFSESGVAGLRGVFVDTVV
jgi:hypothetical protein